MTISTNKADRLALIKKIAERRTKMENVKRKTRALKPQIKKSKNLTNMPLPKETNIYQWTDASSYAKEYYGETMYETTRYDNDWD